MRPYLPLIWRQCQREWLLTCRQPRDLLYASVFFLMMLVFLPLTVGTEPNTLRLFAPGLIWIDVLFAFFLSSERLFQQEYDEGLIEQWLVSGYSISAFITTKTSVHGFIHLMPLLMLSPLVGILLHLSAFEVSILMLSLLAGTPALSFLTAFASAFSSGLRQKGLLMALILFPLTLPVLILGSGALSSAMNGESALAELALLLALSLLAVGFIPIAMSAVVILCLSE